MTATSVTIPSLSTPTTSSRVARVLTVGGGLLFAGSLAWAVGTALADPAKTQTAKDAWDNATGGLYQIGLAGLLAVYFVTGAAGGRRARVLLIVESVVLALAAVWTVGNLFSPGTEAGIMPALDTMWPLSQLGMLVVAVMVAKKGQWTGVLRWLPLVGALWLLATGIGMGIGGDTGGQVVHTLWHGIFYAGLGALLVGEGRRHS
jgi:hypothetical protein